MMSRRSFACLAVAALVGATLLAAVDPASAQFLRRGSRAGYSPETGYYTGYGAPYSQGWYGPSGYYSSGWGNYPSYSGYGGDRTGYWNTPAYRWSGNQSYWSTPSYYGEGMTGNYYSSSTGSGFGMGTGFGPGADFYGSMSGAGTDHNVLITVRVPPNAEVWFDNQKTSQTGTFRTFISPSLDPDHNFVYQIRARWNEGGRTVDRTRKLEVHAGDRMLVNFFDPRSQRMGGTSAGQYGIPGQFGTEPGTRDDDRALERRDRTLEGDRNREENPDRALENRNRRTTPPNDRPPERP